jgi:hypothetical protein
MVRGMWLYDSQKKIISFKVRNNVFPKDSTADSNLHHKYSAIDQLDILIISDF